MLTNTPLARALALAVLLAGFGVEARADGPPFPFGIWRNAKDTVHVDVRPCGSLACGYVIWATPKALADAKKGGGPELLGSQLLKDFTPLGDDVWRGKVFVPDLGMTFSGTARPVDGDGLKARGCLVAGVVCRSLIWRRIAESR